MPTPLLKKATLYPQTHRSGNTTWIVNVGRKINGKADLHRFKANEDAEAFKKEWNLKLAERNLPDLAEAGKFVSDEADKKWRQMLVAAFIARGLMCWISGFLIRDRVKALETLEHG